MNITVLFAKWLSPHDSSLLVISEISEAGSAKFNIYVSYRYDIVSNSKGAKP